MLLLYIDQNSLIFTQIDADNFDTNQDYAKIKKDRGYNYEDEVTCSSDKLPNYKEKVTRRHICTFSTNLCSNGKSDFNSLGDY